MIARQADRADLVDVLHAKMHAARANGLGKAVVRVVLLIREDAYASASIRLLRHGLRADVHETPLRKMIIGELRRAPESMRVENILRPWHEQPDNRARSSDTLCEGSIPALRRAEGSTSRPTRKLPNQCIFAPV